MVFAVFDQDALVNAMQRVWDKIAPPAMFTAAGNVTLRNMDTFNDYVAMLNWDKKGSSEIVTQFGENYGYQGTSAIGVSPQDGSNGKGTDSNGDGIVDNWEKGSQIYVPAGFTPIKGNNILYADMLPPFDVTLTFGNEYGQCAFQKIYDVDILNEGSGVSVDTVVMERQMTYIARKISPLIRGVYTREDGGMLKGVDPIASNI